MFISCAVWRQAAENVAESLTKGMRVIVTGRLRSRSYEGRDGERRTVFEVEVDEVGPSLKYATAKVARVAATNGGSWNGGNSGNGGGGWANAGSGSGSVAPDPWANAQSDEPPF
jgi:single-strand DNA-binding protein